MAMRRKVDLTLELGDEDGVYQMPWLDPELEKVHICKTYFRWLEKSKREFYVCNILRLNCLTVTVVMWVETRSLNFGTVDVFGQIILVGDRGAALYIVGCLVESLTFYPQILVILSQLSTIETVSRH